MSGRGCLSRDGAAAEDAGDAGLHPEDVHGEGAAEDESGCPCAALEGGESTQGVLDTDEDMQDDARKEEDGCEDLLYTWGSNSVRMK